MERLLRMGGGMQGFGQVGYFLKSISFFLTYYQITCDLSQNAPVGDSPMVDTAEQVYISSLALLKVIISP